MNEQVCCDNTYLPVRIAEDFLFPGVRLERKFLQIVSRIDSLSAKRPQKRRRNQKISSGAQHLHRILCNKLRQGDTRIHAKQRNLPRSQD